MTEELKTEGKTEELIGKKLDWATAKKLGIFSRCHPRVVGEGKDAHIEADCQTKEDSHELADLLEKEVVIRVKPGKVIDEDELAWRTIEETKHT